MTNKKIESFKDLIVWEKSQKFAKKIYEVTTLFPTSEKFSLTDQIRRASVSIGSNIAEGFSKNTRKDKVRFYNMSQGSLSEVLSQINLAENLGYVSRNNLLTLEEDSKEISKLLSGIIKSAQDKI